MHSTHYLFIITIPTEVEEMQIREEAAKKTTSTPVRPLSEMEIIFSEVNESQNNSMDSTSIGRSLNFYLKRRMQMLTPTMKEIEHAAKGKNDSDVKAACSTSVPDQQLNRKESNGSLNSGTCDNIYKSKKVWTALGDEFMAKTEQLKRQNGIDINTSNVLCMEPALEALLYRYNILYATWTKVVENRMHQVIFTVNDTDTYESLLEALDELNIGENFNSTVSVVNCLHNRNPSKKHSIESQNEDLYNIEKSTDKQSTWSRFMNLISSRIRIIQIVRDVKQDAEITFDFIILLLSASILAAFGLFESSVIFLTSSMLISPLMGPIFAVIFGIEIKDRSLRWLGLKNEFIGIFLSTTVGFIFSIMMYLTDFRYGIQNGLTNEIRSRCNFHALVVGIIIAIPSGSAAAIGTLGGFTGPLIGVAISASLLPPAVNAGILWGLSFVCHFLEKNQDRMLKIVQSQTFSNYKEVELFIMGAISMLITITNVICIFLMGVIVLKVKEIAPVICRKNRKFWKHDINIVRDLNKNGNDTDKVIMDEFASLPTEDQKALGINSNFLRDIDDEEYQNTWSPIMRYNTIKNGLQNYYTIHRADRLHPSLTRHQKMIEKQRRLQNIKKDYQQDINNIFEIPSKSANAPTVKFAPRVANSDITIGSSTLSSNTTSSSESNDRTSGDNQNKRRFVVTPAEDPFLKLPESNDVDV